MVNLDEIWAVVQSAGEDQPANKHLSLWLSRLHLDWDYSSEDYGRDESRDQTIVDFLRYRVPKGKKFLLCIDHDMMPNVSTNRILSYPGDMLYCGYADRYGTPGHYSRGGKADFGIGCARLSAEMLTKMAAPYFKTTWEDGRRKHCECHWFQQRAAELGYQSDMAGVCGHKQVCCIFPDESELGWKLAWPPDLRRKTP